MSRGLALAAVAAALVAAILPAACGGDDGEGELGDRPGSGETLYGFNETIELDSADDELLAESGASFVRLPLNWSAVEQVEGLPDFSRPDALNEELTSVGLRPLWVVGSAPCWAGQKPCSDPRPSLAPAPDRVGDYAEFVVEVAGRYPDSIAIEVWNEPNIPNFWRPTPQPELYRELLAAAADAVHESGSEVPVIMAGPSPTSAEQAEEDPMKIQFQEFIREVMSGPDAPDVDAIGLHPYSLLQRDKDPVDESIRLYDEGRRTANEVAPEKPVWVTEVGLTTAGRYAVPAEVQASGLAEILADFEADGVPVVTIHRFFDQADPPFQFEAGFGVVEADRETRKPSFCAVVEALGGECET